MSSIADSVVDENLIPALGPVTTNCNLSLVAPEKRTKGLVSLAVPEG
jgi:hypothetical protein